ncbi:hypothetical protein DFA_00760 [Cavenderia fasciculata]|uniref:Uncharacterized protein n=1 Tax=Cavenderia fasciculata TaxID=261658 RepID=F4PTL3_CACFS|nr:uncharacterized protein DFA_00760 [Cavenderia fasciculata]EGG20895.1 hypothetical protein DFA_00760 [Cavenderia fasciculata]|eukprot:XP_004358745.1 hypothetical protein DFA_00760 [Cavenderia fasciculata]
MKKWGGLEYFKFAVYILMPITCSLYILDDDRLNNLIKRYHFVVYPPEQYDQSDIQEMIRVAAEKREKRLDANLSIEEKMLSEREDKREEYYEKRSKRHQFGIQPRSKSSQDQDQE